METTKEVAVVVVVVVVMMMMVEVVVGVISRGWEAYNKPSFKGCCPRQSHRVGGVGSSKDRANEDLCVRSRRLTGSKG